MYIIFLIIISVGFNFLWIRKIFKNFIYIISKDNENMCFVIVKFLDG